MVKTVTHIGVSKTGAITLQNVSARVFASAQPVGGDIISDFCASHISCDGVEPAKLAQGRRARWVFHARCCEARSPN